MQHRSALQLAAAKVDRAAAALTRKDPTSAELEVRRAGLAVVLEDANRDVTARLGRLEALATACQRHLAEQAAAAQAQQAAHDADTALGAAAAHQIRAGRGDPAADLAERTGEVLAAYRQMLGGLGSPR